MDLKNYKIKEKIGEGSFGTVFRAKNQSSQEFAIKKIKNSSTKSIQNNLENEIKVLFSLDHPSILKTSDLIRTPSHIYIVSDFCSGGDLQSVLDSEKKIPLKSIQRWIKSLIQALIYLNERRIIHRDIKPANVLLTSQWLEEADAKLCDFGFSKKLETSLTKTRLGTPLYMAPEVLSGKSYNHTVDIWSLGIVTFELIYRKSPFKCRTLVELITAHKKPLVFPDDAEVPSSAVNFIKQMCQAEPQNRSSYQDLLNSEFLAEPECLNLSLDSNYSLLVFSGESSIKSEETLEVQENSEILSTGNLEKLKSPNFKPFVDPDRGKIKQVMAHESNLNSVSVFPRTEAEIEEENLENHIKLREIRMNETNETVQTLDKTQVFEYIFKLYILNNYSMILNMIETFRSTFQEFESSSLTALYHSFSELKKYLELEICEDWNEEFSNEQKLIRTFSNWLKAGSFSKEQLKVVSSIGHQLYPADQEIRNIYFSSFN